MVDWLDHHGSSQMRGQSGAGEAVGEADRSPAGRAVTPLRGVAEAATSSQAHGALPDDLVAAEQSEKKIKDVWTLRSKRFLQAELKRRGVTYADLARRLTDMGIRETEGSITVKINRGTFPVWFFLAALNAIGCPQVRLEDV